MLETILALLAACITIFIAGLLVKKQEENRESTKELDEYRQDSLANIANEVKALTGEPPEECTLAYLERRIEIFNKTIQIVQTPTYTRRNKNVKRQKNFADD